jgi:hypothetical protein
VLITRFSIVSALHHRARGQGVVGLAFDFAGINDHSRFVVGAGSNCSSMQTRDPAVNSTSRASLVHQPTSHGVLKPNAIYSMRVAWNATHVDASDHRDCRASPRRRTSTPPRMRASLCR